MIQRSAILQSVSACWLESYANDTAEYHWQLMNADCVFDRIWNLHEQVLLRKLHNIISQQAHTTGFVQAFNDIEDVLDFFHYTKHNQMINDGFRVVLKATPKQAMLFWYEYDTVDIVELT